MAAWLMKKFPLNKAFTLLEPGPVVLVAAPHFALTAAVSSLIVNI